jgi:tRNA(Arg) A34 adenosine deaminase TadA
MNQIQIMIRLIEEAKNVAKENNYPLSACIVKDNQIISIQHTSIKTLLDPTAHAEILAIREACKILNTIILDDCWLYTTLEPCPMCVSACIWAKVKGIVFGSTQEDAIEQYKIYDRWRQIPIKAKDFLKMSNSNIILNEELMREECNQLFDLVNF